jgi:hypothetical protein
MDPQVVIDKAKRSCRRTMEDKPYNYSFTAAGDRCFHHLPPMPDVHKSITVGPTLPFHHFVIEQSSKPTVVKGEHKRMHVRQQQQQQQQLQNCYINVPKMDAGESVAVNSYFFLKT